MEEQSERMRERERVREYISHVIICKNHILIASL